MKVMIIIGPCHKPTTIISLLVQVVIIQCSWFKQTVVATSITVCWSITINLLSHSDEPIVTIIALFIYSLEGE
jgi:hypothetical protein